MAGCCDKGGGRAGGKQQNASQTWPSATCESGWLILNEAKKSLIALVPNEVRRDMHAAGELEFLVVRAAQV